MLILYRSPKEHVVTCAAIIAVIFLGTASAQVSLPPEKDGKQKLQPEKSTRTQPGQFMRTLPVIAALDADRNGELSAEEIDGAAKALKTLDQNRNGMLEREEFQPGIGGQLRTPEPPSAVPTAIAGIAPRTILELLGARGKASVNTRTMETYHRVFNFTDRNRDGRHSRNEYIDNGRHLTRDSRSGIFQASDTNRDGFVSREEYVMNRIITDEAKAIFDEMDANTDRQLTAKEVNDNGKIKDSKLAEKVFHALDSNRDGKLNIAEYLHVWGRWARSQ
ncbi:MAG: hypothetical protein MK183_07035 [Verrucomicrobiales bacterium]|nr:hypothetical protein [Verrucomicrobiales bacterium]